MRVLGLLLLLAMPVFAQQPHRKAGGGFQIGGVVVNAASGQPLVRTRVAIGSVDVREQVESVITDSDGRFSFEHLAAGKYSLSAERSGFPAQSFDQHELYASAIAVGNGLKATGLVFRLQPEAVISGTIQDEADEPVRDAEVILFHRAVEDGRLTTHVIRQTQTDDQGGYRFGGLLDGTFLIAVRARPWYVQTAQVWNSGEPVTTNADLDVAFPTTFYPGVTGPDEAAPIAIRSGDQVSADFVLQALPAVRLHIQQANPDPAHPITGSLSQRLFDDFEGYIQTQNMWHSKVFTISGFAPGNYTVHVNSADGKGGGEHTQDLAIMGDTTVDPDAMSSAASVKVSGTLRIAGYTGSLSNAVVQLERVGQRKLEGSRVSADGSFELTQLPSGTYEVRLFNMPDVYVQSVSGAGASGRFVKIGSSDVSLVVNAAKGAGKITGTVMQGDSPQPGAMVLLAPDDPRRNASLFRRDQSDSDGTFTLSNVLPGHYTLMAIMDGWELEWSNPEVLKRYLPQGESINVERGGKYDVKVKVE